MWKGSQPQSPSEQLEALRSPCCAKGTVRNGTGPHTHVAGSEELGIPREKGKSWEGGTSSFPALLVPCPLPSTKRSHGKRLLCTWVSILMNMVLLTLVLALMVLYLRPPSPAPDFPHTCPDTWIGFQGRCYFFSTVESNWTSAQESCQALGASLATINSPEELAFVNHYRGGVNHWFGLQKEDARWVWVNGTPFNHWFEVRGSGFCAYLNQERISSSLCHTSKNWLCSRPDSYVLWRREVYP
uniref:C-type lectin domain family 2 member D2-like n=1 Tax=Hypotaenidia okinawae TaxID=2861861 RepID=A0A6G1RSV9_9GRUI